MNDESQRLPDLTQKHVNKLTAVFISHLHQDHIGALSLLVKFGYQGPVIVSEVTHRWLAKKELPLNFKIFRNHLHRSWQKITSHLEFYWGYSGHVIGSNWYSLFFHKKRIFFSGDVSLSSTLYPVEGPLRLSYDLALLDSGNAGMPIDNLMSKQKMLARLTQHPEKSFQLESKFNGKCIELLLFFYEMTQRPLVVDQTIYQWLLFHEENRQLLLKRTQKLIGKLLKSERLKVEEKTEQAIFFYKEQSLLESNQELLTLDDIPFKSHLDTSEIYYLNNYIAAKQTIFFHNQQLSAESTIEDVLDLAKEK